jgi:hypothetical protein
MIMNKLLIYFYISNASLNLLIFICIYGDQLFKDWNRNRTDFWLVWLLGLGVSFIPIINTIVICLAIFLMIIIPMVETILPYRYSYKNRKFEKKD